MKIERAFIVGATQLLVFLVFCALLYQTIFVHFLNEGKFKFLGSGYFFILEMSIIPAVNLLLKKYKVCVGNIIGIALYFLLVIPFAMLLS